MTDLDTPNAALAYEALDLAMAHRPSLFMDTWVGGIESGASATLADLTAECGTTGCLAAWTAAVKGYRLDSRGGVWDADGYHTGQVERRGRRPAQHRQRHGLRLFHVSEEDLAEMVAEIFGPRPTAGAR
jgi:hypothetical protein